MTKSKQNRWADYSVLGLSVFLIFCLLFESYIELPNLVSWLGRWHPLVLHFPIVLLLVAIFLGLTAKAIPWLLLYTATISALLTAVLGFFLGMETPVKGDLLFWHQWLGGATALLAALWYALYSVGTKSFIYTKAIPVVLIGLVGFTGHYGGMVTHGEEFLALPTDDPKDEIPENPLVYQDVVYRILDEKCVACHNPNKQKGELVMTNFDRLLQGGENGPILVAGSPEQSEMIKRMHLPMEDELHMPPEGKTPLEETEIAIIERWIATGASDTIRLEGLPKSEPLVAMVRGMMRPMASERWVGLPKVADSTLKNLASDYLTLSRIASNSEALSAVFFRPPEYDPKTITDLQRIAANIVELDVSGLPIGSPEMDAIASFTNLEQLELDRTPVTDSDIKKLSALKKLRLVKVYGTSITDESISIFKGFSDLENLYIWDTGVTEDAVASMEKARPNLNINDGIEEQLAQVKDSVQSGE